MQQQQQTIMVGVRRAPVPPIFAKHTHTITALCTWHSRGWNTNIQTGKRTVQEDSNQENAQTDT